MITFTKLGQHGRLGNQFFQYAATKSIALEKEYDFKIPLLDNKVWHGQYSLLENFNINAEQYTDYEKLVIESSYQTFTEKRPYIYQPEIKNIEDNTNLFGYFQDKRYFIKYIDLFRREFTPKDKYIQIAYKRIKELKEIYDIDNLISIHIRRGDVIGGDFSKNYFNKNGNISNDSWYYKYLDNCINFFGKKYKIFSIYWW